MKKILMATMALVIVLLPSCGSKNKEKAEQEKQSKEILSMIDSTMVLVEGGTFTMGDDNGPRTTTNEDMASDMSPAHEVTLDSYYICKYEVTQALWEAVIKSNPSEFKGKDRPVEKVSWKDCKAFIKKLNEITGKNFRLPTEAEWEYAACGGNKSHDYTFAGGDDAYEVGCICRDYKYATAKVGSYPANELGLYDMTGNVWEWCEDNFGKYTANAQKNPLYKDDSDIYVRRGGSWVNAKRSCENKARFGDPNESRANGVGFRLAISVEDYKK